MTGFEQSRTLNVPFAAPKILVFLPRKFGGCRVFSANYGITWTQIALLGLGYHLHLGPRACIPFLYHITFS